MTRQVVIVGGGQAGFQTAASLRQNGFEGRITIVAGEDRLPYQRPPLSKAYLKGERPFDSLVLRPESFYLANRIDLLIGDEVVAIDRQESRVTLQTGGKLPFDALVLAVGVSNRLPAIDGIGLSGVHLLRTAAEADALREVLAGSSRIVIIGGGFIGLEVAATARQRGLDVVVLEAADRLMARAVSPAISQFFLDVHRAMGSNVLLGTAARRILGRKRAEGAEAMDGRRFPADLVLVAAGVTPNLDLAWGSGLAINNGIVVDECLRTADPRITAIGDCAVFPIGNPPGRVRLESVQNAVGQAKCVAETIVGRPRAYDAVPWFWSDQATYKLQIVGLTAFADDVHAVGSADEGQISAYCFRRGRLIGIETVNRPADHMRGRKINSSGAAVSRDDLIRHNFDLKSLALEPTA